MKELAFENGTPRDATCTRDGHAIIDRPGANPVCRRCGQINPTEDKE